jgi:hypothetical protein
MTVDAAVQRYEQYLHALGREDVGTLCEIAGRAAKKAEEQGFGPCATTFPIMLGMVSPEQKKALMGATVDSTRVTVQAPNHVEVPARAVKASVTFTEGDLGDAIMEHIDGIWYVTD